MKNLTVEEKTEYIDLNFSVTYLPYFTQVVYNDGTSIVGYFQGMDDESSMLQNNKFRFLPIGNIMKFRDELEKKQVMNKELSVIVDVRKVVNVRPVVLRSRRG